MNEPSVSYSSRQRHDSSRSLRDEVATGKSSRDLRHIEQNLRKAFKDQTDNLYTSFEEVQSNVTNFTAQDQDLEAQI